MFKLFLFFLFVVFIGSNLLILENLNFWHKNKIWQIIQKIFENSNSFWPKGRNACPKIKQNKTKNKMFCNAIV